MTNDQFTEWLEERIKSFNGANVGASRAFQSALDKYRSLPAWIPVTPETMPEPDTPVYAIALDYNKPLVMMRCRMDECIDGVLKYWYAWHNCYGDINADDPRYDDDYVVTHWFPINLPAPPQNKQQ